VKIAMVGVTIMDSFPVTELSYCNNCSTIAIWS